VGQGQFGQVFCAVERQTGQLVALKEITHRRLSTSKFLRELGSLLTLQHPNIVTCRAFEATTTARYLVMDYCEGGTLRDLLESENSLSLGEALTIMQGILAGLEQAHRHGIIHCDIKPENILLGLDAGMWLPRLSDFGIARRLSEVVRGSVAEHFQNRGTVESADGSIDVVGAPGYTSPEAFYGMYSRSSDIYAMGIVFFELLLGHRPFTGIPERLMWAHLNQPLQIPSVLPEPLQAILKQALAKLKGRRYGTAAEMSEAIAQVMNHPEISPLMTKFLPFKPIDPDHDIVLAPQVPDIRIVSQQELPGALTGLASGNGYLYGIFQQNTVLTWEPGETEAVPTYFPEPVSEIIPLANSCLVSTCEDPGSGGSIYWVSPKSKQPKRLLKLKQKFTLSADPESQSLAVAAFSQSGKKAVRFGIYSLGSDRDGVSPTPPPQLKLLKSFTLAAAMLPQLMFLDRRHLLTIWHSRDAKKSQTIFKLYSRRGTQMGSVRSPLLFEQLILSLAPGTSRKFCLFGVVRQPRPAIWRIQLLPLQLARIPLETMPTCLSPIPSGCLFANDRGEIRCLDRQGQNHGKFQFGFQAPLGFGVWRGPGEDTTENLLGLGGVTAAANGSCISFLQVKTPSM
jgi:serine/threonine-protein kinase